MHDFQTIENIRTRRMRPICNGPWDIRLGTLPVVTAACTSLTFIITYVISVYNHHVYPYFPTISNTGGKKPESNIFSVLLSVCSFLMFLLMWVRYIQYKHVSEYNETEHGKLLFANKLSFAVGIVACIGALVVAGFQVCFCCKGLNKHQNIMENTRNLVNFQTILHLFTRKNDGRRK